MHATVVAGACGLAAMIIGMRSAARHRPPVPPPGGRAGPRPALRFAPMPALRFREPDLEADAGLLAVRRVAWAAEALRGGPRAGGPEAAARHLRLALGCAAVALTDGARPLAWDGAGAHHTADAVEHSRTGQVRCEDPRCPVRQVVAVPLGGGTLAAYGPPVTREMLGDVARLLGPERRHQPPGPEPRTRPPGRPSERTPIRPPGRPATGAEVIPAGVGGVIRFVRRSDVRYAEAHGDYARLYTQAGTHLVRVSLAALEEAWGDAGFVRIHRSHLVALAHVDEMVLDQGRCTLRVGGARLTVSRRNTGALRDRLVRNVRPGSL
ncbi:LytR/AlgR family response regulator transcription factor [Actinomadura macra]|uniref:LytR/AlgR family response regulator transcription factor n=1 Tax=Actinomadura macra TaxID=46164 RepID=UPI00082AC8A2|nr:LytTR family DNA-binding domain-containing protein [Actinomadura macra]